MTTAKRVPIDPEVEDYGMRVLDMFLHHITDLVFLSIQDDRDLMQEYLRLLKTRDVESLNRDLGRVIKERLNLKNIGREKDPASTLIKTYEAHGLSD